MSMTGAVKLHASAYDEGGVTCSRSGTAPDHHGSPVRACSTSVPTSIRTPVSSLGELREGVVRRGRPGGDPFRPGSAL